MSQGHITYSMLEEAAMMCGIHNDQSKKLFDL